MDKQDINSYRLTSMEEPTDEMLSQIMREAAEEAKRKGEEAHKHYFEQLKKDIEASHKKWSKILNISL